LTKKGPEGPLYLTEVGFGPPRIPHLPEDRHDLIDDCAERGAGILSRFDEITTLFGMLHERCKFTGFIFIDQDGSVTPTTGSCTRTADIRRYVTDGSFLARKDIGP
jgi:hypothetical protein